MVSVDIRIFSLSFSFLFFFLMIRRPPRSTRTDTLFPYTTLFRSRKFFLLTVKTRPTSRQISSVLISKGNLPVSDSARLRQLRSEEHTSELQSLMRNSYAVFCLKKKKYKNNRRL